MREEAKVFSSESAKKRLEELGIPYGVLENALSYGASEMAMCTEFDTPGFAGMTMYSRTYRRMRETLSPEIWGDGTDARQPRLRNSSCGIEIIHSLGNESTGNPDSEATPSQKYRKGEATVRAVKRNLQDHSKPGLFPLAELTESKPVPKGDMTWILLYQVRDGAITAELSKPNGSLVSGFVTSWSERIVLEEFETGTDLTFDDPVDVPVAGFEVDIKRRA